MAHPGLLDWFWCNPARSQACMMESMNFACRRVQCSCWSTDPGCRSFFVCVRTVWGVPRISPPWFCSLVPAGLGSPTAASVCPYCLQVALPAGLQVLLLLSLLRGVQSLEYCQGGNMIWHLESVYSVRANRDVVHAAAVGDISWFFFPSPSSCQ